MISAMMPILGVIAVATVAAVFEQRTKRREENEQWRACFETDLSLPARRFRERSGLSEAETGQVEQEFRRYFLLIAENAGAEFGLENGPVDDFWHELICCTALYGGYCQKVAGRFIHHDPEGGSGDGYARIWWAYHDRFLQEPPLPWWPAPVPAERPAPRQTDGGCSGSSCSGGGGCGCSGGGGGGGCCGGGCSGGGCGGH